MSSPDPNRTAPTGLDDPRLRALLDRLPLEEKVQLVTGRDLWSTWPNQTIGLRPILVSDGPSGVRGEVWDERSPSVNLPSATALSSSWDPEVAHRYGAVAAAEARRKGVDVVLGPTINLHRSPLGGRHFEAFSEDPRLTADLAEAYVRGLQDNGVAATPKHYVANDSETDRFTVDVAVSSRALRELYLLAFERSITEAGAWTVMSAYNSVNGSRATEHALLDSPLTSEWGFDGVVVSDWGAVRSLRSAEHAQDLVMPGPDGPWGDALVDAVRSGRIDEAVVDRKVLRLLLLAARVGALDGFTAPPQPEEVDGIAFARLAAAEGTVLVHNEGLLPLDAGRVRSIAVVGDNAVHARTQGGGSATVIPATVVSPLAGVRAAFVDAEVTYARGAIVHEGLSELDLSEMTNPVTGEPGLRARFLDADGSEMFAEDRFAGALVYLGGEAPVAASTSFELHTRWTPDVTGPVMLGCAAVGTVRIHVDGALLAERHLSFDGDDPAAALLAPPAMTERVEVVAGRTVDVRIELEPLPLLGSAMSITVGTEAVPTDPEALLAEAATAAEEAEVAVVVVGTNARVESEGHDRTSLSLPGRQDDLVRAVAAVNPNTVVVVNSGAPVLMPWRESVSAILLTYFGGQELGHALADVLTGDREPGGRLPTTWPAEQADVPVIDVTPTDGRLRYTEGIHIGYRAWLRAGREPAHPFGWGLGYTTWELGTPTLADAGDAHVVTVPVTNTGDRAGKQVVQVYAERPESAVDRPARWLVGFAVVRAEAGSATSARVTIPRRALAHWDDGWHVEPGAYGLRVGTSLVDLPGTVSLVVD